MAVERARSFWSRRLPGVRRERLLWIDALGSDEKSATHVHLAFQAKDAVAVAPSVVIRA